MEDTRLEARVGAALLKRRWMFCCAESCTGGLLMHRLTNISGSSSYIAGGVVTYAYEAKERLLNVRADTLTQYGAVSEETAREMAQGVVALFGADIGLSITGIAGPTGGLPHKPVGLTYIGISVPSLGLMDVKQFTWQGDRETNKFLSVNQALLEVLALAE